MIILYESLLVLTCIICVITTLWFVVYNHRLQKALYWFYGRQYRKMRYLGVVIRERILQDLFIFRRNLELSALKNQENQQKLEQYDLKTFENIHHSLKQLSEYLYPAHIDDSLSLAITNLLESWKLNIPNLNLQLNIPNDWHEETYEYSRIILMILEELLEITLPLISEEVSIFTSLEQQGYRNKLIVKLNSPNIFKLESSSCLQQLNYLKNIFAFLTSGKCFYSTNKSTQIWYLNWDTSCIKDDKINN